MRILTATCVVLGALAPSTARGAVAVASASSGCSEAEIARLMAESQARQEELRKKCDVDVEVPTRDASGGGVWSTATPEGTLHVFCEGKGRSVPAALVTAGTTRLRMCLEPPTQEHDPLEWVVKDSADGFRALHGDDALARARAALEEGDRTKTWLSEDELPVYRDVDVVAKAGLPLADAQRKAVRAVVGSGRAKAEEILAAYGACRGNIPSAEDRARLGRAVDAVRDHTTRWFHVRATILAPDQRRAITRHELQQGGSSSGSSVRSGLTESMSRTFQARDGAWTCSLSFGKVPAREALGELLTGVCDETLGELVVCALDPRLAPKLLKGQIRFRSIKEGLDQLATLAGGKLVSLPGGTWRIEAR